MKNQLLVMSLLSLTMSLMAMDTQSAPQKPTPKYSATEILEKKYPGFMGIMQYMPLWLSASRLNALLSPLTYGERAPAPSVAEQRFTDLKRVYAGALAEAIRDLETAAAANNVPEMKELVTYVQELEAIGIGLVAIDGTGRPVTTTSATPRADGASSSRQQ